MAFVLVGWGGTGKGTKKKRSSAQVGLWGTHGLKKG